MVLEPETYSFMIGIIRVVKVMFLLNTFDINMIYNSAIYIGGYINNLWETPLSQHNSHGIVWLFPIVKIEVPTNNCWFGIGGSKEGIDHVNKSLIVRLGLVLFVWGAVDSKHIEVAETELNAPGKLNFSVNGRPKCSPDQRVSD